MSNFDNITKIKENFVENLNENKSYFNKAKSALTNFDNFMQNSPKIVASLAAACIVATTSLGYNIYEDTRTVSLDMYNTNQVAQVKNRTDAITTEFLKTQPQISQIKNKNYNDDTYEFNNGSHDYIKDVPADKGTVFKNPFWPNNIVTVYNKPNEASKYHPERLNNHPIDKSNHVIDMDYNQIRERGILMGVSFDKQYLTESLVFYHEAAHASYSQSIPYSGATTNRIDNELKSDISALIYIGHQKKEDFDYLIDKAVAFRILTLSEDGNMSGFSHNTAYGLMELKKAIQKNPMILDIAPENISQFSDMFVKELKSVNLSSHHENSLKEMKYPTSEEVHADINANKKSNMYKSILYYQINEGVSNNKYNSSLLPSVKDSFTDPKDIQKISETISSTLKTNLRYDTVTSIILQNSDNPYDAITKMSDMVNNKPAIKNDFITAIAKGNLIYMDELKVNIEPVKKVEEESQKEKIKQLEQKNENELKRKVELQKPTMNNNAPT